MSRPAGKRGRDGKATTFVAEGVRGPFFRLERLLTVCSGRIDERLWRRQARSINNKLLGFEKIRGSKNRG